MTAPITIEDVRSVNSTAQDLGDDQVQNIADFTNGVFDELLAGTTYSIVMISAIKRFAAGHYVEVTYNNNGVSRRKMGSSEEEYAFAPSDAYGLAATTFGRQALALDVQGILTPLASKPMKAEFRVI